MTFQTLVAKTPITGSSLVRGPILQRKCACGQHTVAGGACASCRENDRRTLQRSSSGAAFPSIAPPIVHEVLRSPGQPLDRETRDFMEPRFGHDFSRVRLHEGARAADSARAIQAKAYTVGQDVVFGVDQYAPKTPSGRNLLSHELAHVVQQTPSGLSADPAPLQLPMGDPSDRFEQAAEAVANEQPGMSHTSQKSLPSFSPASFVYLARQTDGGDGGDGGPTPTSGGDDRKLECGPKYGCPYKTRCGGKLCEVIDCGTGPCPTCPPGLLANLVISAWCTYRCYPGGAAFILMSRIGNFPIGPFCVD